MTMFPWLNTLKREKKKMRDVNSGDVWLAKFHPSSANELKKYRPAVILNALTKYDKRFVLIVPLSSLLKKKSKADVLIHYEFLTKPSLVLCWHIRVLDRTALQSKLGSLDTKDFNIIKKTAKNVLN